MKAIFKIFTLLALSLMMACGATHDKENHDSNSEDNVATTHKKAASHDFEHFWTKFQTAVANNDLSAIETLTAFIDENSAMDFPNMTKGAFFLSYDYNFDASLKLRIQDTKAEQIEKIIKSDSLFLPPTVKKGDEIYVFGKMFADEAGNAGTVLYFAFVNDDYKLVYVTTPE